MNFKRLELYGFKSFADKTVIEFNEGITGIVGPNGSGKSNFSDAIKWVLGEQSAKQLRGKNMQDVIFVGTQRRTQMSYCEVTLVFDNTDQKIFKTLAFDEVSFTRKLYRSGDSEYLLNGTPILLKNMRDIIRDTGLGKDGYSIIGQGRVAEIINSKPENRRVIFEEAAGISKYKKRKDEAEDKLEKTRDHLDRVQDIIKELERQLVPLQKKAENAKKYLELYDRLRLLEVNHFLYAYENNDLEIEKINQLITSITEEIEFLTEKICQNDKDYFANLEKIQKIEDDLNEYRDLKTRILVANQEKLGKGETLQERLSYGKNEEKNLINEIENNSKKIENIDEIIDALNKKHDSILFELNSLKSEYENKENEMLKLTDEINKSNDEFEQSERKMLEAIKQLSSADVDYTKLETQFNYLSQDKIEQEEELKKLKEEIVNTESEKKEIEKEINHIQTERNNIYKEVNECKKNQSENRAKMTLLENTIRDCRSAIASYEMQETILMRAKNQYESFTASVQKIMQYAKQDKILDSKMLGVVAELINVPARFEVAIEVALGGALQNIVTANIDDVKYCIEILKRYKMGTITFLPINSMRPRVLSEEQKNVLKEVGVEGIACDLIGYNKAYDNVFKNLLGATVICDTYDNANKIAKKYNRSFRIVTLEGEIFSTQGSVTGGSRKQDAIGILGRERELEFVIKNIEKSKQMLAKSSEEFEICGKNNEQLNFLIGNLNGQLIDKEVQFNTTTNKLNDISDKLDILVGNLTEKSATFTELCEKLEFIEKSLSGAGRLRTDISSQTNDYDDKKAKTKEALNYKVEERNKLSAALSNMKLQIADIANKLIICKNDIDREVNSKSDTRNAIVIAKSNLEKVRKHIEDTENQMNSTVLSDADKAKVAEIDSKIDSLTTNKNDLNKTNRELLQDKDENNQRLQVATNKRTREEGNIEKLRVNFANLTNRIDEEYGLNYDSSLPFKMQEYNDSESLQEITHLKRSISGLGEVSPSSIQEYEDLSERHNGLSTERDDLLKAESDLNGIIRDLSREMQEIFDTEFAKIAKNFEVTFKEIFGGGSGKLLIDPNAEDPLTAGVEIVAMLPGKNTKNLSALSGGEMALTAIAILFSILKTKPMPFCLLDEIEAALDDGNAALFAKYLKKFVGNTQFIVITHRKPTMEQADRLFGVTMEERGVSKVVSVELSEAVKAISEN